MARETRVNAEAGTKRQRPPFSGKKPKLGQNFLHDEGAAKKIVEALGDVSARTVVEIGPGQGILTDRLLPRAGRLVCIELDRVLAAQLRLKHARAENLEIIEADVLKVNFPAVLTERPTPLITRFAPGKADVIGNLPYYITSDILLRLFEFHEFFDKIVIMVQREVADRISAKPGNSEYGLLSATAQLYTKVEKMFTLPPGAFAPPPTVHSSVLRLTVSPRFQELRVKPEPFIEFLKQNFAQKRKTLVNNLRGIYAEEHVRAALKGAAARPDVRAEALTLEKAAAIFRELWPGRPEFK
jgi:16S rRNA (adenine1518-N6/adenine1519-N6)-dimethyltransferase